MVCGRKFPASPARKFAGHYVCRSHHYAGRRVSSFPGTCRLCHGTIATNDPVLLVKDDGAWWTAHAAGNCEDKEQQEARAQEQERKRKREDSYRRQRRAQEAEERERQRQARQRHYQTPPSGFGTSPSGPHGVLYLLPTAPPEVVKAVRKVLALKYHPDMPGGNEEKMKQINAAADLILRK